MKKEICLFFMTLMWLNVKIEGKFLLLRIKESVGYRKLKEIKGKSIFYNQISVHLDLRI